MKRPMRRRWAVVISLLVFLGCHLGFYVVFWGWPSEETGPLYPGCEYAREHLEPLLGANVAAYLSVLAVEASPALVGGTVLIRLLSGRREADGYLHCLKCGYILKGISEPRCPECGERI